MKTTKLGWSWVWIEEILSSFTLFVDLSLILFLLTYSYSFTRFKNEIIYHKWFNHTPITFDDCFYISSSGENGTGSLKINDLYFSEEQLIIKKYCSVLKKNIKYNSEEYNQEKILSNGDQVEIHLSIDSNEFNNYGFELDNSVWIYTVNSLKEPEKIILEFNDFYNNSDEEASELIEKFIPNLNDNVELIKKYLKESERLGLSDGYYWTGVWMYDYMNESVHLIFEFKHQTNYPVLVIYEDPWIDQESGLLPMVYRSSYGVNDGFYINMGHSLKSTIDWRYTLLDKHIANGE